MKAEELLALCEKIPEGSYVFAAQHDNDALKGIVALRTHAPRIIRELQARIVKLEQEKSFMNHVAAAANAIGEKK